MPTQYRTMKPVFNFVYLLCAYSLLAGAVYFAFYEKDVWWARLTGYALGGATALFIFNGKFVEDNCGQTNFSSAVAKISFFFFVFGLIVALLGLWALDLILGNFTISASGWCIAYLSLLLAALGKLVRELHNKSI
ncbi:MAG: hypothetical protein LCH78_06045 [Proteobacteria bacterium]|nr:hypothetical protein [Pseudomonadota bacterium]